MASKIITGVVKPTPKLPTVNNTDIMISDRLIRMQLADVRKSKNITQKQLSAISGLSESCISNIENGYSFPRMGAFLKLCAYFEVNSDYFISGSIGKDINEKIIELLATCSIEELKCIWKLFFKHRIKELTRQFD